MINYILLSIFIILLVFGIVGLICLAAIAVYKAGWYMDDTPKWVDMDHLEEGD